MEDLFTHPLSSSIDTNTFQTFEVNQEKKEDKTAAPHNEPNTTSFTKKHPQNSINHGAAKHHPSPKTKQDTKTRQKAKISHAKGIHTTVPGVSATWLPRRGLMDGRSHKDL